MVREDDAVLVAMGQAAFGGDPSSACGQAAFGGGHARCPASEVIVRIGVDKQNGRNWDVDHQCHSTGSLYSDRKEHRAR